MDIQQGCKKLCENGDLKSVRGFVTMDILTGVRSLCDHGTIPHTGATSTKTLLESLLSHDFRTLGGRAHT